jgi:hypothetical protein
MALMEHVLNLAEPALLLGVIALFLRSGSAGRFPALASWLGLRLTWLLFLQAVLSLHLPSQVYQYGYYAGYIVCSVAIFFVIQEIFRHLMEPVPGLRRLGLIAFRWITIISVIISAVAVVSPSNGKGFQINLIALQLMRSISIMELCLLVFLALAIHSLGRSFRSRIFGIALGFGLQATLDLILSAFSSARADFAVFGAHTTVHNIALTVTAITLLIWMVYFLVPEPAGERMKIVLPLESPILRWNEIAKALGHSSPQVAVGTDASGFFLQDVERVVDKVLAKNALNSSDAIKGSR